MLGLKSESANSGWPAHLYCMAMMLFFLITTPSTLPAQEEIEPFSTDEITAAVLDDFPPLYSLDESSAPTGFAIDILMHLSRAIKVNIRYLVVENWADAMQTERTGKAELISGIEISPTRWSEFLFTEKMETIPVSCFARIKNYSIKGIESLPRHRVAVIGQSADETKLKPRSDIKIVSFPKSFLSREIL